ncbi:MAG: hypothetical protein ACYDH3_06775 [Candidatus Aminicenantales bacterium]
MKKALLVVVLVLAVIAGTAQAGTKEFYKGGIYVTPQIGLNSWGGGLPFGVGVEYAVTPNIGVGGSVMLNMWSDSEWSQTLINFNADVAYHFTKIEAAKFDLYAGGGLGYSVYSWKWKDGGSGEGGVGSSGIYIPIFVGGRYYFNPKMAVSLRLVGSLTGHWAGFGGVLGLTFAVGK